MRSLAQHLLRIAYDDITAPNSVFGSDARLESLNGLDYIDSTDGKCRPGMAAMIRVA
jgi:hypothetical protein